jgi:hypothetical protein
MNKNIGIMISHLKIQAHRLEIQIINEPDLKKAGKLKLSLDRILDQIHKLTHNKIIDNVKNTN